MSFSIEATRANSKKAGTYAAKRTKYSTALPANEDALCNMFKKKFTAKQQLPSDGFFDQAAEPVQHARLGLLLADHS